MKTIHVATFISSACFGWLQMVFYEAIVRLQIEKNIRFDGLSSNYLVIS